jgi:hypothetical protein
VFLDEDVFQVPCVVSDCVDWSRDGSFAERRGVAMGHHVPEHGFPSCGDLAAILAQFRTVYVLLVVFIVIISGSNRLFLGDKRELRYLYENSIPCLV